MAIFKDLRVFLLQLVFGIILFGIQISSVLAQSGRLDSSKAVIEFQKKQVFNAKNGTLHFSNTFTSARLNGFKQENDSTFKITVTSENAPINSSPWYAFKIWSTDSQTPSRNIVVKLNYPNTKHRYNPKISSNGSSWTDIEQVELNSDKSVAEFKLAVGRDTILVSAQELINSNDSYRWMDSLAALPFVKKHTIGYSLLGKPIIALNTTGSDGKKLIVVLSRQHPPEVTGYMAMQEFVRSLTGSSELAQKFRARYELLLMPMLNPDGVDEGNWRHSAAGVDLNRDWEFFKQPETRAAKDYISAVVGNQNAKVYFGIDFHSTYNDVFYTNEDQPNVNTNAPGFTVAWLKAFENSIPGFKTNIKPSPNGGNVSKSWMGKALAAEALTYEVGDITSRKMLKIKGRIAAETMMKLLLDRE